MIRTIWTIKLENQTTDMRPVFDGTSSPDGQLHYPSRNYIVNPHRETTSHGLHTIAASQPVHRRPPLKLQVAQTPTRAPARHAAIG